VRTEGTGFGTVGNVDHLRLTRANDAAVGVAGTIADTYQSTESIERILALIDLSISFYWGSIDGTSTPLPVELTSFTAALKFDIVELKWSTASELNNDHFTIERSTDLREFSSGRNHSR
jgi:hypothetical protein